MLRLGPQVVSEFAIALAGRLQKEPLMNKRIQLQPVRRDPIDVAKLALALVAIVREQQAAPQEATTLEAEPFTEPKP